MYVQKNSKNTTHWALLQHAEIHLPLCEVDYTQQLSEACKHRQLCRVLGGILSVYENPEHLARKSHQRLYRQSGE